MFCFDRNIDYERSLQKGTTNLCKSMDYTVEELFKVLSEGEILLNLIHSLSFSPLMEISVKFEFISQQEALSSILSAGQRAYTEYSSFSGPPKGE